MLNREAGPKQRRLSWAEKTPGSPRKQQSRADSQVCTSPSTSRSAKRRSAVLLKAGGLIFWMSGRFTAQGHLQRKMLQ